MTASSQLLLGGHGAAQAGPYSVIYADPPWQYRDTCDSGERGAEHKYPTMGLADLRRLPVSELADDDAMLFMWATGPLMREAFELIAAWGFDYIGFAFVWVKLTLEGEALLAGRHEGAPPRDITRMGMGHWTRANAEVCLLGVRGRAWRADASVRQVVLEASGRHSAKPDEVRRRIVRLCGDVPRIELFARERVPGWSAWGNEVESDVRLEMAHWRRMEVGA